MKKILLLVSFIGTTVLLNAQYPITGATTPDGIVPGSPQPDCNYNTLGANSCPRICLEGIVTPNNPGVSWDITLRYYNPTNGVKSIRILIKCGTDVLVDQCMDAGTAKDVQWFKTYTAVPCTNLSILEISLTPFTGNTTCLGTACGPTETSVGGAPLPVMFKSFTAVRIKSNVLLKWETASEEKNKGFDVQRFIGSGNWESVGFVSSKADNGSSSSALNYEFTDINNVKGITQYRLKLVDMDGKSAFSLIRSIRGEGQSGKTIVYPNPTNNGKVNIVFDDGNTTRDITLLDLHGRTVKQWRGTTNNNIQIENLNAGFYSILIVNRETGEQVVEKVFVQKR